MSERLQRFLVLSGHAFLAPIQGGKGYIFGIACTFEGKTTLKTVSCHWDSLAPLYRLQTWGADYDKYFVYARARVMVYHVHESLNKPQRSREGEAVLIASEICGTGYWMQWLRAGQILALMTRLRSVLHIPATTTTATAQKLCRMSQAFLCQPFLDVLLPFVQNPCFFLSFWSWLDFFQLNILNKPSFWCFPQDVSFVPFCAPCAICLHLIPPRPAVPGCTTFWVPWKMTRWWVTTRRGGVKFVAGWWPLVVAGRLFDVKPPSRLALDILWQFGCCLGIVFWCVLSWSKNWKPPNSPVYCEQIGLLEDSVILASNRSWQEPLQLPVLPHGLATGLQGMESKVGHSHFTDLLPGLWDPYGNVDGLHGRLDATIWLDMLDMEFDCVNSLFWHKVLSLRCLVVWQMLCVLLQWKVIAFQFADIYQGVANPSLVPGAGTPNKMHSCSIQSWSLPSVRPSDNSFQLVNGKKSSSVV